MLWTVRFIASTVVSTWGLAMLLIGLVNGVLLWSAIGLAVMVAGLPLLAAHPWAAARLYPPRTPVERTA